LRWKGNPLSDEFELITTSEDVFTPAFTDGSLTKTHTGSAVFFKEKSPHNWSDLTIGKKTILNAELFALEAALAFGPKENMVIFTDSLSALSLITQKERKYSDIYKCENRAIVTRILELIKEREQLKYKTKFEWIPSHTADDKNQPKLTEQKEKQIKKLQDTYGDETFKLIVQGNKRADELAKNAKPGIIFRKGNETRGFPKTPNPRWKKGQPRVNITITNEKSPEVFEGDIRRLLKTLQQEVHASDKPLECHESEAKIIEAILKDQNHKLNKTQKFLIQLLHNAVATPSNIFPQTLKYIPKQSQESTKAIRTYSFEEIKNDTNKTLQDKLRENGQATSGKKAQLRARLIHGIPKGVRKQAVKKGNPISFYSKRKYVAHNTPFCHKKECTEHTVANIKHIICHDPEACKALDESMNRILEGNKVQLKEENRQYWKPKHQDTVLSPQLTTAEKTISEEDKLLAEVWEIKESHLIERSKNEEMWRPHAEESKKQKQQQEKGITKWENLMPKKVFKNLKKELGTPEAIKVSIQLTINQLEAWRKMKDTFWKTKYQGLEKIMNVSHIRIRRNKKDNT
jgi:hypothetical protein